MSFVNAKLMLSRELKGNSDTKTAARCNAVITYGPRTCRDGVMNSNGIFTSSEVIFID